MQLNDNRPKQLNIHKQSNRQASGYQTVWVYCLVGFPLKWCTPLKLPPIKSMHILKYLTQRKAPSRNSLGITKAKYYI